MSRPAIKRKSSVHTCDLPKTSDSNLLKLPINAKFYLHWKRRFQKLIIVSDKHPLTRFHLRSRAAIAFERRRHSRIPYWWVIHPFSRLRYTWDIIMVITYFYFYITAPYVIVFHRIAKSAGAEYLNIIYPACVVFIIDIFLNLITGYVSTDGHEIFLDPLIIIRHYLKGYFIIDLISSVPYQWFDDYEIPASGPGVYAFGLIPDLFPIIKILRIDTLRCYIRQFSTTFGFSHAQKMIIWMLVLTMLSFHWSSCLTYAFPYVAMHLVQENIEDSGTYLIKTKMHKKSEWKIYSTCLHIGVSDLLGATFRELDLSGALDNVNRCVLLLLGRGYMIYLIVIVLQLIQSWAQPEIKYQKIMRELKQYINEKKIPQHLQDKLIAYYEYRFQGSFFTEKTISSTLSSNLNQEILIHSSRGLIETATIFHNLPRSFLGDLIAALKPVIYLENDIIYKSNSDGDCMYFIASGTVALVTFLGEEVCHLRDGHYFGETALIYPDRRHLESVIALEICEFLRFDRREFKHLVSLDSEFYARLKKIADERLQQIRETENKSRETKRGKQTSNGPELSKTESESDIPRNHY